MHISTYFCVFLFLSIHFTVNANEISFLVAGKQVIAKQLTNKLAFEMIKLVPKKTTFESYDDLLKRYIKDLPKNWFYLDYNFEQATYNTQEKRFEWKYIPIVHIDFKSPSYKTINLLLERNIVKKESGFNQIEEMIGVERSAANNDRSVANYLLTKGFASNEPVIFEMSPQLAKNKQSVRIFFQINTLELRTTIQKTEAKNATSEPVQKAEKIAVLGISKNAILRINEKNYGFTESSIDWEYSTEKGFKIVPLLQ